MYERLSTPRLRELARQFPDYSPYQVELNQRRVNDLNNMLQGMRDARIAFRYSPETPELSPKEMKRKAGYVTPSTGGRSAKRTPGFSGTDLAEFAANYVTPPQYRPYVKTAMSTAKMLAQLSGYKKSKFANLRAKKVPVSKIAQLTKPRKGLPKKFNNVSTGIYGGTFAKPSKKALAKVETLCLSQGYHRTAETYGAVADTHCAYIHHSTYNAEFAAYSIVAALIRKLFKKAGYTISARNMELMLYDSNNSDGFKVEYLKIDPTTNVTSGSVYVTTNENSLQSIVTNFTAFLSHIVGYIGGLDADAQYDPYMLNLYISDRNGFDTNWRNIGNLPLQNESITLFSSSSLVVQNRTAGATAAEGNKDSDRVDNQPLRGYLYEFRNADPRLRNSINVDGSMGGNTDRSINVIPQYGMQLVKSADLPTDYQEPPVPKVFSNVISSSKVVLQPGTMKKCMVSHKMTGKLKTVLLKLRPSVNKNLGGVPHVSGVQGRAQMLALEEYIRTENANTITLQYERELKIGVITKSGKAAPFTSHYTSNAIDRV